MRAVIVALALLVGCNEDPGDTDEAVGVPEFGADEGRSFEVIATEEDGLDVPRDLAFNPDSPDELWVVNQATDGTVTIFEAGGAQQHSDDLVDSHASHFMIAPSSIAFGASGTFATCPEGDGTENGGYKNFMGPVLWSSDLDVYAEVNQNPWGELLGSHLDMLHESPFCMGIEHEVGNAYWVFDGYHGDVVRYDFNADHGPGYDDHSDGIVRRYPDAEVSRVEDVPGHLVLDQETGWLYIADTGAGRILALDTTSGEKGDKLDEDMEPLQEYVEMVDVTVEVIAEGFDEPSGIALHDGRLFVGDHATGEIVALDLDGAELGRIQTDAEALMGITVGPDGKLWYVDAEANTIVRIDPAE